MGRKAYGSQEDSRAAEISPGILAPGFFIAAARGGVTGGLSMHKKIHNMAVFIEFLAGSGLAIFFHLVLHHAEAAYIIFGIGVLLSLATYLLREDIAQTRDKLIDQYDHAHEITF